jgi:hypothetical protein
MQLFVDNYISTELDFFSRGCYSLSQGFTGVFRQAGETFVHIQLTRVDKKSISLTANI